MEADKCEDPHVERILEGVAFLTARIRRKIEPNPARPAVIRTVRGGGYVFSPSDGRS